MKYLTKEWLNIFANMVFPPTIIDKRAKAYSEQFFQETMSASIKRDCGPDKMSKETFGKIYNEMISQNKKLPDTILKDVADIRVLALGVATRKVANKIRKYNKSKMNEIEKHAKAYRKYYKSISSKVKGFLNFDLDYMHFHDSHILKAFFQDSDYVIIFDFDYAPNETHQMIFRNAELVKDANDFPEAFWLYEEVCLIDNRVEWHILLDARVSNDYPTLESREFVIKASSIELFPLESLDKEGSV